MQSGTKTMNKDYRRFNVPLPPSSDGYLGRQCSACDEYFKLMVGTGLQDNENCYCPYCGFHEHYSDFHTKSQIDYATSLVLDQFTADITADLNRIAHNFNRQFKRNQGLFSLSMEVKNSPTFIQYPADLKLETYIECPGCALKYAVYGVYAYCPDCGLHNAFQTLENNLDISRKLLELSSSAGTSLVDTLIGKALSDVVSSFDGFGREICLKYSSGSADPHQAERIRFQNLEGAQRNVIDCFGFDLAAQLNQDDWQLAIRCFQKRHLLEHRSGVVDKEYLAKVKDPSARVGRKVRLSENEVRQLITVVRSLGSRIFSEMEKLP